MAITSTKDVQGAFAAGRRHLQRFTKNAGITGDAHWQDWSYASGQPAYDARIGTAGAFTPFVAQRNDAIWFPDIDSGQTRHLSKIGVYRTASGNDQTTVDFCAYDLVGVYPLIDGDSTDPQPMDNTEPYPRCADGVGLQAILVNHVSPGVVAGAPVVIDYTDTDDTARQMTVYSATFGLGKAAFSIGSAGPSTGCLYLPAEGRGVKSIDSVQFTSAPGGLWAIYIVKPLGFFNWQGGLNMPSATNQTVFAVKDFTSADEWDYPRIYDGAWIGFFYMPTGSSRTVSLFGFCEFFWG